MDSGKRWGIWGGAILIGLGVLFLIGTLLRVNVWSLIWPFFIIAPGLAFFAGMYAGGKSTAALAVPGSVITTIGLILFFQNLFGIWASWAYAWALIIVGAGIGLLIFGARGEIFELRGAGRVVVTVGLVLFFVFGVFFELGASLLGMRSPGGVIWPVLLILLGVYVLFGSALRRRWEGPAGQKVLSFASPTEGGELSGMEAGMVTSAVENGVAGVRRVKFGGLGDMVVMQGENEGLKIDANQTVLERIRAEVRGDTLEIRFEQDWWDWLNPFFWNVGPIRYSLELRDLQSLQVSGIGSITVESLKTDHFELVSSGTGSTRLRRLEAGELKATLSGVGSIDAAGLVRNQTVQVSGTGSYSAGQLESQVTSVRISGVGSARVRAVESLDVSISGTGSVDYYGSPRVTQNVSGLGSARRLGA